MKFNVGDKAIFRTWKAGEGGTMLKVFENTIVVIVSPPIVGPGYVRGVGYDVRFQSGLIRDVGAVCLHPLPPEADRFEAGEWELCPWRPKEIEVLS